MRTKATFASLALLAFFAWMPTQANAASDLYKFCHSEASSAKLLKYVGGITGGLGAIKGTLSAIYAVEKTRALIAENAATTYRIHSYLQHPLGILVPATKGYFKAITPTLKHTSDTFKKPKKFWNTALGRFLTGTLRGDAANSNSTSYRSGYSVFYQYAMNAFRVWDYSAPVITAYLVSTKSLCAIAKTANSNCKKHAKDKNKCALPVYNDLPEGKTLPALQSMESRSCSAQSAAAEYIKLSAQLAPTLRQMQTINRKLLSALEPFANQIAKAKSVLQPIKGSVNSLGSVFNAFKTGLSPLSFASKQMDLVMGKKICIKLKIKVGKIKKQTKKCSRIKNLAKDLKKYVSAAQKAFQKATAKLIDPILNKVRRKVLKIPGMNKISSIANKVCSNMVFVTKLQGVANQIKSFQLGGITGKLKNAKTKLDQLNSQMR